jgi:glycosyltransferase involved in cell wall biosynthesis
VPRNRTRHAQKFVDRAAASMSPERHIGTAGEWRARPTAVYRPYPRNRAIASRVGQDDAAVPGPAPPSVGELASPIAAAPPAGETIVCFSSIDWDFNWQGHQELASWLARHGNRVLFVDNTGVRTAALRDVPRLRQRFRNWRHGAGGLRAVQPGVWVLSPLLLPLPYSALARSLNRMWLLRSVRRWLRSVDVHRPIVWTFLPTPLVRDLIRALQPELCVYYCVDDMPGSSPAARRVESSETALFREADLVLVTSEKLRARALRHCEAAPIFPFGVSAAALAAVDGQPGPPPQEVRDLPRPVVGYVGGVNVKLDQALLAQAAALLPEASFVLVGPVEEDAARLRRVRNVHLLGPRPHADVVRFLRAFDVGIVPYRLTDYTAHVFPTKLTEYLAAGLPVVATPLHEITRFNAQNGDVIQTATGPEDFAAAIRRAAAPAEPPVAERRAAIARTHAWDTRLLEMFALQTAELQRRRGAVPLSSA